MISQVLSKKTALSIIILMKCLSDLSVLQLSGTLFFVSIQNRSLSLVDFKEVNQEQKVPNCVIYGFCTILQEFVSK